MQMQVVDLGNSGMVPEGAGQVGLGWGLTLACFIHLCDCSWLGRAGSTSQQSHVQRHSSGTADSRGSWMLEQSRWPAFRPPDLRQGILSPGGCRAFFAYLKHKVNHPFLLLRLPHLLCLLRSSLQHQISLLFVARFP